MAEDQRDSLLGRILRAIGLRSEEIAAGHGTLPETGARPSTRSRLRSRERERERSYPDEESEKAAEAIAEAADALDEQIRRSVDDPGARTSDEMIERAKRRWSSD